MWKSWKYWKIAIVVVLGLCVLFTLYPHSGWVNMLWLIGSAISPGQASSFTGWFVFFGVAGVVVAFCAGLYWFLNLWK